MDTTELEPPRRSPVGTSQVRTSPWTRMRTAPRKETGRTLDMDTMELDMDTMELDMDTMELVMDTTELEPPRRSPVGTSQVRTIPWTRMRTAPRKAPGRTLDMDTTELAMDAMELDMDTTELEPPKRSPVGTSQVGTSRSSNLLAGKTKTT